MVRLREGFPNIAALLKHPSGVQNVICSSFACKAALSLCWTFHFQACGLHLKLES